MVTRIGIAILLTGFLVLRADAQRAPSADSLVAYWLNRGVLANWSPGNLFVGCPDLAPWQQRGIQLLLDADLTPERRMQLAMAWGGSLNCNEPRLEQWYFTQVDAAIRAGADPTSLLVIWGALSRGDSPGIREYLRNLMGDATTPAPYQNAAGSALFARFRPEERLREYMTAFETGRMPFEIAVDITHVLLRHDAKRLLKEVGDRVRQNPGLADQLAFAGIVQSSDRYATPAARQALAEALEAGMGRPEITSAQRQRLEGAANHLRRNPN